MVTLVVILLEVIREEKLLSNQQKKQIDPLKEYSVILPTATRWLQVAVLCLSGGEHNTGILQTAKLHNRKLICAHATGEFLPV